MLVQPSCCMQDFVTMHGSQKLRLRAILDTSYMWRTCYCQNNNSSIAFKFSGSKSPAPQHGSGAQVHRNFILRRHSRRVVEVKAVENGRPSYVEARVPSTVLESINEATKWSVVATVTATVGIRHDAVTLWCVIGSVIAAAISKVGVWDCWRRFLVTACRRMSCSRPHNCCSRVMAWGHRRRHSRC